MRISDNAVLILLLEIFADLEKVINLVLLKARRFVTLVLYSLFYSFYSTFKTEMLFN